MIILLLITLKSENQILYLSDELVFPPVHMATHEGLLAMGGDLSLERLLLAYQNGIFPWFTEGEPILWWSPDPRLVLLPSQIKISTSLRKAIRQQKFEITMDKDFEAIITHCAQVHTQIQEETWITTEMIAAYCRLHAMGYAHSVEVWFSGRLVGGLYGVALGRSFFGESMFSLVSNASKVALAKLADYLTSYQFDLIDCQVTTQHLKRLGAIEMPRVDFINILKKSIQKPSLKGRWEFRL